MRQNTCKHFNGTHHNEKCEAGVCYRDVTPDPDRIDGYLLRLPCFKNLGLSNPNKSQLAEFEKRGTCEKYEEPTKEDIAAYDAEMVADIERTEKTIPICSRIRAEHKGENWSGVEACPVCGGSLHLRHAACNGHIHASCETKDCISFME